MKCLSIQQPYTEMILRPSGPGHTQKRCENRTWPTSYRGPLLLHASKSRHRLKLAGSYWQDVPLGAIVGRAELVDCVGVLPAGRNAGHAEERARAASVAAWP